MTISVAPTQTATVKAIGDFIAGILPAEVEVFVGQANRVPEPAVTDFVVMTPIRRERLATNVDTSADAAFTASIAGTLMSVTTILVGGPIALGATLFGSVGGTAGLVAGTTITAQVSGTTGGVGTYRVSASQNKSSRPLAAGQTQAMQPTEVVVQFDVHGPNSADNAQIISTLFRDDYGVRAIEEENESVTPLYADDPRQLPFINAEQQYEDRWVIEAHLQVNPIVTVPQQYAAVVEIPIYSVEATLIP